MKTSLNKDLENWYRANKREFPWRDDRSVYSVVVSEFMLQQTKASVVIPYYNRWMKKFPSFKALCKATEAEVMKMWEGLGYYSRARNLRAIAIEVMHSYGGVFPNELEKILSLKGIGEYTASAIYHFAFNKRALGADGNIKKVITRVYGHKEISSNGKQVLKSLDHFLPKENSKEVFEGLIELGATICSKDPKCSLCPLNHCCKAYEEGVAHLIPVTKKRAKITPVYRAVFIIKIGGKIGVIKQESKLMRGLFEFPYIEIKKDETEIEIKKKAEKEFSSQLESLYFYCNQDHVFTRYKAHLFVYLCTLKDKFFQINKWEFLTPQDLEDLAFSSGHKKILNKYLTDYRKEESFHSLHLAR